MDIGNVVRALGNNIALGILGLHSFTGCDNVSSSAGREKVSALKLLKGSTEYQKLVGRLGAEWTVDTSMMQDLEKFTCALYAPKSSYISVNELRYPIFRTKKEMWSPISYPAAVTAFNSISEGLISKLLFGKDL